MGFTAAAVDLSAGAAAAVDVGAAAIDAGAAAAATDATVAAATDATTVGTVDAAATDAAATTTDATVTDAAATDTAATTTDAAATTTDAQAAADEAAQTAQYNANPFNANNPAPGVQLDPYSPSGWSDASGNPINPDGSAYTPAPVDQQVIDQASQSTATPTNPLNPANMAANQVASKVVNSLLTPTQVKQAALNGQIANPQTTTSTSSGSGSVSSSGSIPGTLSGTGLAGAPVYGSNSKIISQLKQMYPQLNNVDPRILNSVVGGSSDSQANSMMQSGMGALGSSAQNPYSSMVQSLLGDSGGSNPSAGLPIAKEGGGTNDILSKWAQKQNEQEGTQMMNSGLKMLGATNYNLPGNKDGGHQHKPEFITGATGHYVKGKGDGQSDDIPAMLADGEYVFDADTVAALGNGSSDAGAKLLDHFRESLREHKRSAPVDKIPPAASPLAYMKEALKRHKQG